MIATLSVPPVLYLHRHRHLTAVVDGFAHDRNARHSPKTGNVIPCLEDDVWLRDPDP